MIIIVYFHFVLYNDLMMNQIKKSDGFKNEYLFVISEAFLQSIQNNGLFSFMQVTDMGYFPKAQYHYRNRPEGCSTAIFLYCFEGKGFLSLNGNEPQPLEAGQCAFIPPDTPHCYGASEENPWSIYWFHFTGGLSRQLSATLESNFFMNLPLSCQSEILSGFSSCFELLKEPYQTEKFFLICQQTSLLLAQAMHADKTSSRQLSEKGGNGVDICIRYMKENLHQPAELKHLAEISGFSSSHLNTLFKQSTGFAPVEYFLHMKIQAASKALYFTQNSIKEIAVTYGFEDPYYFSRLFKKITGLSPDTYRKQNRG